MNSDIMYKNKYLKYKAKYIELKNSRNMNQSAGGFFDFLKKKPTTEETPKKTEEAGVRNLAKLNEKNKSSETKCKCECPKPVENVEAEDNQEVVNESSAYDEVVDEQ